MQPEEIIANILLNCEKDGSAPKYIVNEDTYKEQRSSIFLQALPVKTAPVKYNSNGEEIFIVSDLHIAAGRNKVGIYKGTENFFADDSFHHFLEYTNTIKKTSSAILIINGDIFDFLRITDYPGRVKKVRPIKKLKYLFKGELLKNPKKPSEKIVNDEYTEWIEELKKVGIKKTRNELEESISRKEKIYGLGTEDYKTIYKLIKIKNGHPVFFKALSFWLASGNKLIILKGNHDVEIYWQAVRNYLRLILAEEIINNIRNISIEDSLKKIVLPHTTFIDDSVEIDKNLYVEHGHRYDKFTLVLDTPYLKKHPQEINIPFGSFFNRYLLNRVELFFPFLDNVRPVKNILPLLIKENFPLAVKVLFQHIPMLIRIITTNIRYAWFMFNRVVWFFLALAVPLFLIIYFNYSALSNLFNDLSNFSKATGYLTNILEQAKNLGLLIFSYLLSRIVAWLQISEPSSLDKYGKMISEKTDYEIIAMGHTHNPGEYLFNETCRFYNTGTWIPIIENSNAEVREDKTYTFLHLNRDATGKIQPANNGLLQRWNDYSGRAEPQILIERK